MCNQVKNSGSFHLTACTLFGKVVYLCFPIDHKHYIGWYCTGFIYGYVVRRLVIIIIIIIIIIITTIIIFKTISSQTKNNLILIFVILCGYLFVRNQVKNSGSFHLTACTIFSKVVCLCFPIDHKCIGWYCMYAYWFYIWLCSPQACNNNNNNNYTTKY